MSFEILSGRDEFLVGSYWCVTLADYSRHVAPSVTATCRHWYTNDGDGLNANQARQLGADCNAQSTIAGSMSMRTSSLPGYSRKNRYRCWLISNSTLIAASCKARTRRAVRQ
jgi:hypothetical protein